MFQLSLCVAGLALLTACREDSFKAPAPQLPTARVKVTEVTPEESARFASLPGTVVPLSKAVLESKIAGQVTVMNALPGQEVTAGALLVELDVPEIVAEVAQATAAMTHADQIHERTEGLFQKQSATRAELDAAVAQLNQAKAARDAAKSRLADAQVVAPFAGVISVKHVEVGDLATPGRPLLTMETQKGQRFEAGVPESLLPAVRLGATNRIVLQNVDERVTGVVGEIHPSGDPATRSWTVKWNLPPDAKVPGGGYGQVAIPSGASTVIRIPASALRVRGQLELVYVVERGHAVMRLVRAGEQAGDRVSILSGLTAGDRLIVSNLNEIQDGQPVEEGVP